MTLKVEKRNFLSVMMRVAKKEVSATEAKNHLTEIKSLTKKEMMTKVKRNFSIVMIKNQKVREKRKEEHLNQEIKNSDQKNQKATMIFYQTLMA